VIIRHEVIELSKVIIGAETIQIRYSFSTEVPHALISKNKGMPGKRLPGGFAYINEFHNQIYGYE